jgi:hypothetical protein
MQLGNNQIQVGDEMGGVTCPFTQLGLLKGLVRRYLALHTTHNTLSLVLGIDPLHMAFTLHYIFVFDLHKA